MRPTSRRPHRGHRPRPTFIGQVAYRVKHKIALKVAMALLKLAVIATIGVLMAALLLLFYVAQML